MQRVDQLVEGVLKLVQTKQDGHDWDAATTEARARSMISRADELGLGLAAGEDAATDVELAMRSLMDQLMGAHVAPGGGGGADIAACHALLRLSIAYATLTAAAATDEKTAALAALAADATAAERDKIEKKPWPLNVRLPFVLLEDLLEVSARRVECVLRIALAPKRHSTFV